MRNFKFDNIASTHGVLSLCHGAGTDAIAAALEGYNCLGIEKDKAMVGYANARVTEFFKAEQRRAKAYSNGALDYDALVNYSSVLQSEALQEKQRQMQALTKILSNVKGCFGDEDVFGDKSEQSIAWSTYQLHLRFAAGRSGSLGTPAPVSACSCSAPG